MSATLNQVSFNYIDLIKRDLISGKSILRFSPWGSIWRLIAITSVIALCALLVMHGNYYIFVFCFFSTALMQYHLMVALHEAIHFGLFPNKTINDFVGKIIAATQFADLDTARRSHLEHHRRYGTIDDPDYYDYSFSYADKSTLGRILYILFHSIVFVDLKRRVARSFSSTKKIALEKIQHKLIILVIQLAIFCFYYSTGGIYSYFLYYLAPLFLLSRSFNGLRMFCEHAGLTVIGEERGENFYARTTQPNNTKCPICWWLEKLLLSPFNFNYHHEHHMLPSIPFINLPKLHQYLRKLGHYETYPEVLAESYWVTLSSKSLSSPANNV